MCITCFSQNNFKQRKTTCRSNGTIQFLDLILGNNNILYIEVTGANVLVDPHRMASSRGTPLIVHIFKKLQVKLLHLIPFDLTYLL